MNSAKVRLNIITAILTVVTIIHISPIVMVLMNSFKANTFVSDSVLEINP